jgi:hypothetical protein
VRLPRPPPCGCSAGKAVTIITDAGFRTDWFRHISLLGWSFVGRVRGLVCFRMDGDTRMKIMTFMPANTR